MNIFRLLMMVTLAGAASPLLRSAVYVTNNSTCCNKVANIKQYSFINDVLQYYCPSWSVTILCGETLSISDYTEQHPGVEVEVVYQLQSTHEVSASCGPEYTLSSSTWASHPAPQSRTKLGIGEVVTLSVSPTPASGVQVTWSNNVTNTFPNQATFTATAPSSSAAVSVTIGDTTLTEYFEVVAPTGVTMVRDQAYVYHQFGLPSAGMKTTVYITPTDVNFENLEVREGTCSASVQGYYAQGSAPTHPAGSWVHLSGFLDNYGTTVGGQDNVANKGSPSWTLQNGTLTWPIPWRWRLAGSSGDGAQFTTVVQTATATATGKVTVDKASASLAREKNDPNGNWTPPGF